MDQARVFIAIVLSFLVFFVWEMFFVDREAVKPPVQSAETRQAQGMAQEPPEDVEPQEVPVQDRSATRASLPGTDQAQGKQLVVETDIYRATIDEKGAVFKSFVLKKYKETVEADSDNLEMIDPKVVRNGTVGVRFPAIGLTGNGDAVYKSSLDAEKITVDRSGKQVRYSWVSPEGVGIEKAYHFEGDSYLIPMTITIRNNSGKTIQGNPEIILRKKRPEKDLRYGFEGPSALIDQHLEEIKIKDIEDKDTFKGKITWMALEDRYFMSCIIPVAEKTATMKLDASRKHLMESRYIGDSITLKPGTQIRYDYKVFFGPRSVQLLKSIGHELDRSVDFGWFDFIAKPCLWLMNYLYRFIPNYGVSIIILTLLIKVLLWPLGNKSYKSMSEMKKIQPLMAEIREKYKDDKKRMNEETMALYRIYKINPMGGCLPMVVQIPVFFAFYRMLYEAIELRHAPFFGWINDLSAPDRLFNFGFAIPMMEPPYGIPVLTVIMGATMFLQQKMSPPMGDPAQAKVMMFMPIIFTVIFINFSSGLVLYWLVNNVLSISQQYYVQKKVS